MVVYAHRFTRHAFVLSPLSESPRHLSQNFSSSFFKEEGFLPAKEAPSTSFSVRIMLLSADEELDDAMISLLLISPRPFQPCFHVLESRPFRVAAIYEYGVYLSSRIISKLCVFNPAYIGLFDRSLPHMSLNQVELAL